MGALANTARGVWETTEVGREIDREQIEPLRKSYVAALREDRETKNQAAEAAGAELEPDSEGATSTTGASSCCR